MEAAHTQAQDTKVTTAQDSARRCLVTGEVLAKDLLIRFVVGPDAQLVFDLAQTLPGRGLWVTASRDAVTEALKKNLFSKAAKTAVTIDAGLFDQMIQLMRKRCLDFLGLARRAGIAVLGQLQVEAELKSGKLGLLLLADDAKSDMQAFRAARDIFTSTLFSRQELGMALGHEQLVYLGLKPHALTAKLRDELIRLAKMTATPHISQGNG
ncbi:MAG: DUF448 domain-containing protein [Alphaproteobacteria bacterium]